MCARATQGVLIREATQADNSALIALELRSPVVVGGTEDTFDRSPDFFACQRVQGEHRFVLAEIGGVVVGGMAGVLQSPVIQGQAHRLVYIQRARVDPEHQGKGVAWLLANDLFAWSARRGAEGPYYLIAPSNQRSIAFGGRAGRRWPLDLRLASFDVTDADGPAPPQLAAGRLDEAAALINATHNAEEFFEPLAAASLSERLSRDTSYSRRNVFQWVVAGQLVAVAGLWDKGAATEAIERDVATGVIRRSRGTAVVDWGWAPGHEGAFANLLRGLASISREIGRNTMTVCEPRPDTATDIGLARHEVALSVYTPTLDPPPASAVRGVFADLLIT